jgi:hypothetical protein
MFVHLFSLVLYDFHVAMLEIVAVVATNITVCWDVA